jgi:opacity protein-like surface antigen
MKKFAVVLVLVLLASIFAVGQDKASVFGGWQYLNVGTLGTRTSVPKGWDADVALKALDHVSLVADISGNYKSLSVAGASANIHLHNFMFGPRFSMTSGKVTPFAETLIGISHLSGSAAIDGVGAGSGSANKFALAFGGGLDVNANKNVAIRLAKFDYQFVKISGANMNNIRLATGIVFKF